MQPNIEYTDNQDGTVTAVVRDANNEVVSTETFHSPYVDSNRALLMQLQAQVSMEKGDS